MNSKHIYSSISRTKKKLFFVLLDMVFLPIALWSSFALRFSDLWPIERMQPFWWMFILMPACGVVIFLRLGLYRAVVRFMGQQAMIAIIKGVLLLSLILYATAHLSAVSGFPRSIPINFLIVSALYVAGTRYAVKGFYQHYIQSRCDGEAIAIYGAGEAGMQLSMAMMATNQFNPVAFIDDDESLNGQIVNGISVYAPASLEALIRRYSISRVVLAIPAASATRRRQIVDMLKPLSVHVQSIPTLPELASGTSSFEQLQEVALDDLLGRDVIEPDQSLLIHAIRYKVIMVTGAGGSIGSEICRQIIRLHPQLLVLYDISEYALYTIDNEISGINKMAGLPDVATVSILGSVTDAGRVDSIIRRYGVNTIFHAAAYKHVPMVEKNVLEGVRNNILGTSVVARAALNNEIERFILISSDKAVRPSNVMGATKRVAEQVVQCCAEESNATIFAMVRFGNVLGSSGSVVPLFRKQIEEGGPVTVTHENVTRYFMSISEAAQLVIQSGAMAAGGEVFVLDMGSPVRIYELARSMIELSGRSVRDADSPDGDIEIHICGLRPGEKLFEELLIGDDVEATAHARIMRANEKHLSCSELEGALVQLVSVIESNAPQSAREILNVIVNDYTPSPQMVDLLGDGIAPG